MSFPLRTYDEGKTVGLDYSLNNTGSAPITASDVKTWAKADYSADDTLIGDLIDEVIDVVERQYNFTIVDKTVTATWESYGRNVDLPFGPVKSITSVKNVDNEGTETTLTANEDYVLRGDSLVFLKLYQYEREFYRRKLEVVYKTGWSTLPNGINLGLKKAVLSHYYDRQDNVGGMSVVELPNASCKQFQRYRNY